VGLELVNVAMTCRKLADPPPDVPSEELGKAVKYYHLRQRVIAMVFRTGKVKVFSRNYPPPDLGYYGDCRVDIMVARGEMRAVPEEELRRRLSEAGFGDFKLVTNALMARRGETSVRVAIPRRSFGKYKVMIFTKDLETAKQIHDLLQKL
jgi:hypothetical protein